MRKLSVLALCLSVLFTACGGSGKSVNVTFMAAKADGSWQRIGNSVKAGSDGTMKPEDVPTSIPEGCIGDSFTALTGELHYGEAGVHIAAEGNRVSLSRDASSGDELVWMDEYGRRINFSNELQSDVTAYACYKKEKEEVAFMAAKDDFTWGLVKYAFLDEDKKLKAVDLPTSIPEGMIGSTADWKKLSGSLYANLGGFSGKRVAAADNSIRPAESDLSLENAWRTFVASESDEPSFEKLDFGMEFEDGAEIYLNYEKKLHEVAFLAFTSDASWHDVKVVLVADGERVAGSDIPTADDMAGYTGKSLVFRDLAVGGKHIASAGNEISLPDTVVWLDEDLNECNIAEEDIGRDWNLYPQYTLSFCEMEFNLLAYVSGDTPSVHWSTFAYRATDSSGKIAEGDIPSPDDLPETDSDGSPTIRGVAVALPSGITFGGHSFNSGDRILAPSANGKLTWWDESGNGISLEDPVSQNTKVYLAYDNEN